MKFNSLKADNTEGSLFPDGRFSDCLVFGMPKHYHRALFRHWVTGVALLQAICNNKDHINPKLCTADLMTGDMGDFSMAAEACLADEDMQSIVREVAQTVKVDLEQLIDVLNTGREDWE